MKKHLSNINEIPKLGEGVYLPPEISQILKLPYHRVQYMMKTFWQGYSFGEKGNRAVNFFSLIEFYTYYNLRDRGFTSTYIKAFHEKLSKNLHTPYPFASIRVAEKKISSGKKEMGKIWYEYMGEIMRDDRISQPTIASFVKPFLKQIDFGDDQLAKRFYPFSHTKNIVVDPLHQFGQPVISGTNLQTKTIFSLYEAGETKQNICRLYEISENNVEDAIRLHNRKVA